MSEISESPRLSFHGGKGKKQSCGIGEKSCPDIVQPFIPQPGLITMGGDFSLRGRTKFLPPQSGLSIFPDYSGSHYYRSDFAVSNDKGADTSHEQAIDVALAMGSDHDEIGFFLFSKRNNFDPRMALF